MISDTYDVSLGDLETLAAEHGRRIDRRWLSKYARLGLLPPQPKAPGLGRGQGRRAAYSAATAQQLVALFWLLEKHGKNLNQVGWALWCAGYYSDRRYWHVPLTLAAKKWENVKRLILQVDAGNGFEAATILSKISEELRATKHAGRVFGRAKRKLKDKLPEFVEMLMSIISGKYLPIDAHSHDAHEIQTSTALLRNGLSVPDLHDESASGNLRFPIDVAGFDAQFLTISKFAEIDLCAFMNALEDAEINAARREFFQILNPVMAAEKILHTKSGKSPGAQILVWCTQDADVLTAMLFAWILMRRVPGMQANAQSLIQSIANLTSQTNGAENVSTAKE